MFQIICLILSAVIIVNADDCKPSVTTASGPSAPGNICSGQLIYHEPFDSLDKTKWVPLQTFWDGGNKEFQWYVADDENSYAEDGKLYISPTLTVHKIGPYQLEHGHIRLENCTDSNPSNCERKAAGNVIINPIRSARLTTEKDFSFKYGRIEVIAKVPEGDWLWPAIWLLPSKWKYGHWPRSGEIDLMESRGNIKYGDDEQIGVEQTSSALHYGSNWDQKAINSFVRHNSSGFQKQFHKYEFVWSDSGIKFFVDGHEFGDVPVGDGFWARGDFTGENIWKSGTKMAPFDEEFHFVINLAVGGYFFPDVRNKNGKRPWNNPADPTAMKEFWYNRNQWLSSWMTKERTSLIIDDIKVYAI